MTNPPGIDLSSGRLVMKLAFVGGSTNLTAIPHGEPWQERNGIGEEMYEAGKYFLLTA